MVEDTATALSQAIWRRSSAASSIASAHGGAARQQELASLRRSSAASTVSTVSSVVGNGHMSEGEQEERRRQIKSILSDSTLSQKEKSRNVQALMDGRPCHQRQSAGSRRGSNASYCSNTSSAYVNTMAHAAAIAARYYADETEESGTSIKGDTASPYFNFKQNGDEYSVASSVTSIEEEDNLQGYQHQQQTQQVQPMHGSRTIRRSRVKQQLPSIKLTLGRIASRSAKPFVRARRRYPS